MPENPAPLPPEGYARFEDRMRNMEERLRSLETSPRAPYTSIQGGSFTSLDVNGNPLADLNIMAGLDAQQDWGGLDISLSLLQAALLLQSQSPSELVAESSSS
jgi:hypothetical protein